ncbi:MAG: hypothetical protein JRJ77_07425 [Deltaproteobacteria bacterium]|nr:hypothetical protein [Deltaproteobacteria bacterium]
MYLIENNNDDEVQIQIEILSSLNKSKLYHLKDTEELYNDLRTFLQRRINLEFHIDKDIIWKPLKFFCEEQRDRRYPPSILLSLVIPFNIIKFIKYMKEIGLNFKLMDIRTIEYLNKRLVTYKNKTIKLDPDWYKILSFLSMSFNEEGLNSLLKFKEYLDGSTFLHHFEKDQETINKSEKEMIYESLNEKLYELNDFFINNKNDKIDAFLDKNKIERTVRKLLELCQISNNLKNTIKEETEMANLRNVNILDEEKYDIEVYDSATFLIWALYEIFCGLNLTVIGFYRIHLNQLEGIQLLTNSMDRLYLGIIGLLLSANLSSLYRLRCISNNLKPELKWNLLGSKFKLDVPRVLRVLGTENLDIEDEVKKLKKTYDELTEDLRSFRNKCIYSHGYSVKTLKSNEILKIEKNYIILIKTIIKLFESCHEKCLKNLDSILGEKEESDEQKELLIRMCSSVESYNDIFKNIDDEIIIITKNLIPALNKLLKEVIILSLFKKCYN